MDTTNSKTTIASLGHRLKQLAKECKPNTAKNSITDEKDDMDEEYDEDDTKFEFESSLKELQEIASVEGYDESSYVALALKDICKQLSNNNTTTASKNIRTILDEVMPFDYNEFFELYKATKKTAESLEDKVCWVLLGPTGAGKSTSIHFFLRSQFRRGNGGAVIVTNTNEALKGKDIKVGEKLTFSQTRYIEEVSLDLNQYSKKKIGKDGISFTKREPTEILFVDSPGFEDTAGPEVNVANGIGTIRALKRAKKVKVIITFKEAHMDYRFKIIRNIANNMGKAINNLEDELDKSQGSPIAGFLTKSEHGLEEAQKLFQTANDEQKDSDSNENAIFKSIIYKFGETDALHEIKIDINNTENNNQRRVSIIKALVEKCGYIESPSTTFNEFISESSLSKLKQQIQKNYNTIFNILDNDKYFENPKYMQYIINILNNIDELKNIIRSAGGQFVADKFKECMEVFKAKWNDKINRVNRMFTDIDINECSINKLRTKMKEFHHVRQMMKKNMRVVKTESNGKYYKACKLKDINCIHEELHKCFDEIYQIVYSYLKSIMFTLKADDSDGFETVDEKKYSDNEEKETVNYNNIDSNKNISLPIRKCFLLYQCTINNKEDSIIRKMVKKLKRLVEDVTTNLNKKAESFIESTDSQNIKGISKLIFMFTNLSKLYNISIIMDEYAKKSNENTLPAPMIKREASDFGDEFDSSNKSSQVVKIIESLITKLKSNISKSITKICGAYSLQTFVVNMNINESINESAAESAESKKKSNYYADVNALLKAQGIKTDEEIRSRENKLISFCEWINQLYDTLNDTNLSDNDNKIKMFVNLKIWLKSIKKHWNEWLSNACLDELKYCNDLLINEGAKSWNNVQRLLSECDSLRKVEYIANNTSQEYFKTLNEFDSGRAALGTNAEILIKKLNSDDEKVDYDEIIKIAAQLFNAGCSTESNEMKQIYNKLKLHVNDLKSKTDAIALSIEMSDELDIIQNTMAELDTLQKFAEYMPSIKNDANGCYKILNNQVLEVLNDIKSKYDLSKCSTESAKNLRDVLNNYLEIKKGIDTNVLINIIEKCRLPTLDDYINSNNDKINTLENRNKSIDKLIAEKSGTLMEEIKKYKKWQKKAKDIKMDDDFDDDDLNDYLAKTGHKSLKEIKIKLKELEDSAKKICIKEQEEKEININEINKLNKINIEVQKFVQAENTVRKLLQQSEVIDFRTDTNALQKRIKKLDKVLEKDQKFVFDKIQLADAHNSLKFLIKCRVIKWSLVGKINAEEKKQDEIVVLSNKYVNEIYKNLLDYLKKYGDNLESNLNDLFQSLKVKDNDSDDDDEKIGKCDLNNKIFVSSTQKTISKLNDFLREFREISNFDYQTKMEMENEYDNDKRKGKPVKFVQKLFTNQEIQRGIDNYINDVISMHKNDINMNFNQWRSQQPEKLPILQFICLQMSSLDRYTLNKDGDDTYYRIATRISGELTESGNEMTRQIIPLFESKSWNQLKSILDTLKKAADANKKGIAQRSYRDAVMQLFSVLNKLINETKTKLLIEISKDNTINDQKMLQFNQGLKDVANLVEQITPHLSDESEKNKVKEEEKGLGILLFDRLRQLMKAAIQSARQKEYKKCEKRLDNIARLMEFNTQFYISAATKKGGNEDEEEDGIASEYDKMRTEIKNELEKVLQSVKDANASLKKTNVFNPYNKLRLNTLHEQLARSQNEEFSQLWYKISDDIVNSIQSALNEVKSRNNQLQMQSDLAQLNTGGTKMMSYGEQETILRKVEMSLGLFPTEIKDTISIMLTDAKDSAGGNVKIMGEGFKTYMETNTWDELARNLYEFQMNNPKLFQTSKKQVINKVRLVYKTFDNNMKQGIDGFKKNIDSLNSYKDIGLWFTKFEYKNTKNEKSPIILTSIKKILEQIYKDIENEFDNKCNDIRSSLTKNKYKDLKDKFYIIITALEHKDSIPKQFIERMNKKVIELYEPIQKLINILKVRKSRGLDRQNGDIDPLIETLNDLKELNDSEFHSNAQKLINGPFKMIEEKKENIEKLGKDIKKIEYEETVKETEQMLTEFKDSIQKEGIDREMVQQNQAKRIKYLQNISMKCKALIKSSNVASKHFKMKPAAFKQTFIKPCTDKMKKDIEQMQSETIDAFSEQTLHIPDIKRANANLEAFYCVKNVFENEIKDDQICRDIEIDGAINVSNNAAVQKVNELSKEIMKSTKDQDFKTCAQNLMNLEYLNQHINFKTSIKENSNQMKVQNKLKRKVQNVIKKSMDNITKNESTKAKINVLYNALVSTDANYGMTFTQQHTAFKASLMEVMNKKFRELPIDALIKNLQETEGELQKRFKKLERLDYVKLKDIFEAIIKKYNELKSKNLTAAESFEDLKKTYVQKVANDGIGIAARALKSKDGYLRKLCNAGTGWVKSMFSWSGEQKTDAKNNPRDCYWTNEMRAAVPDLIAHVLAVWTLSSADSYFDASRSQKALMQPRNAQIIAMCSILCLDVDSPKQKLVNNLVEVGTGEGKSVIMAVTAIVLALLDFDVYCACYSELLSGRDQEAFNDLFVAFNVQDRIQYSTFNNVLERMINDGGDIRDITKKIVLSNKAKAENVKKQQDTMRFYNRQKILFIDEVDKFFSTDFFGKQYTPSCTIPKKEMKDLIVYVWEEYINNNSNAKTITLQKVESSQQYNALKNAFNSDWHDLLKESMKDIIDGIRTFRDDSYKIENGRDICYKFSDTYSSKVFYGYRTLFTYLYELSQGNITDENYVHSKLTWFLKCGSFSYSEIPNDFYSILGVTGTLKSLSEKEHAVIQKSYGVRKYVVMPSLFDKTAKLEYAQNRDIFIIKSDFYFNQLHGTITNYLVNVKDIDRPVIVFFKDEEQLNFFYNMDCCKTWRVNDRIQLLTPDLSTQEKKTGILNATKPNCITFATEEYGRGIDFKVFDKQLENKGMHVELTYWPHTLAEEIQIKGRTSRQGDKGSFHIILNENEIKDQCDVTDVDIKKHKDDGDLYKWLSKIRDKVFEKQYNEASEYVKELRPIHQQSEQLASSLRMANIPVAKEKLLLFNRGATIQSAAKLSILIDATGSMSSCLSQCKTVIQKTIPQLVQFLKDNNVDPDSFEIQVIAYRNYGCNAENILEFCSFTSDENELTKFIHSVSAKGGWGHEAVEVAFLQLNRQEKKPNIVLLMADAPAHTKDEMQRKRKSYGEDYWQKERGGIFKDCLDWNEEVTQFTNKNADATIFCFYLRDRAKDNFNTIASMGKGRSMELNVRNQEESVKLMQAALSETILLKINNGSMEMVEKFRQQHKNMPTFL